eukprot:5227836-Lingulodinium_polyedra.AAC.1
MIAPVIEEGVASAAAGKDAPAWPALPLARPRRNAAAHHFAAPARAIASASGAALNRMQRAGRRGSRRALPRQPARQRVAKATRGQADLRSPAEAVATEWQTVVLGARRRSAPARP